MLSPQKEFDRIGQHLFTITESCRQIRLTRRGSGVGKDLAGFNDTSSRFAIDDALEALHFQADALGWMLEAVAKQRGLNFQRHELSRALIQVPPDFVAEFGRDHSGPPPKPVIEVDRGETPDVVVSSVEQFDVPYVAERDDTAA